MNIDDAIRMARLHERLKWGTRAALKHDGAHKSAECAMHVAYCLPSLFCDDQRPYWQVWCYSYVLGPNGRQYSWRGQTLAEAMGKAEDEIEKWCFPYAMEAFETSMHASDCAIHNAPAEPLGPCDCGLFGDRDAVEREAEHDASSRPSQRSRKDDDIDF